MHHFPPSLQSSYQFFSLEIFGQKLSCFLKITEPITHSKGNKRYSFVQHDRESIISLVNLPSFTNLHEFFCRFFRLTPGSIVTSVVTFILTHCFVHLFLICFFFIAEHVTRRSGYTTGIQNESNNSLTVHITPSAR